MAGETNDTPITTPSDQLSTSNPSGATTGNTTVTGMPPDQQPQGAVVNSPATMDAGQQTTQPQVSAQAGQAQAPQAAPAGSMTTPAKVPTHVDNWLATARRITDDAAGGDPYKTTIDPNTGQTTRVRQPLSGRAMTMSLILTALQGGLSGAGAHGPDAVGQAAQAGLKQGQQIADQRQEAQAKQDQEAQTDLRNRQQVVQNLLQTRLLAQSLGKQSMEQAQQSVATFADRWKQHQDDPSSILGRDMSHDSAYAMLNKQPMGTAEVEITGTHPRTDKDGKLVYQNTNGQIVSEDTPGAYVAPDFDYAVVKSNAKVRPVGPDGKLDAEHALAQKRNYTQYTGNADGTFPQDFTVDKMTDNAMLMQSRTASAAQKLVDTQRAAAHLPPLNIDDDLAQNSNVRNGLNAYMAALNTPGANYTDAYNAVLNAQGGKFANAAGTIQNWFGGKDHVATLNAGISAQDFNTAVKADPSILADPKNLQKALSSGDPVIKAAGVAQQKQNDQEAVHQETLKANIAENAHVHGEEHLEEFKAQLANKAGMSAPAPNETPVNGVRQNYLASLGPDASTIKNWGEGRGIPAAQQLRPNKDGTPNRLIQELNNAYPFYDATKFPTYQKWRAGVTSGKDAQTLQSLNQFAEHIGQAADNATFGAVAPGLSSIERIGQNQNANSFDLAMSGATTEVGKLVAGKALTEEEGKEWKSRMHSWTPGEFKQKAQGLLALAAARQDAIRQNGINASPSGVLGSDIHFVTPKAQAVFNKYGPEDTHVEPSQSAATPSANQMPPIPSGAKYARDAKGNIGGYVLNNAFHPIGQ